MKKFILLVCNLFFIALLAKGQSLVSITPAQGTAGTTVLQALITSNNAYLQSASPSGIGNLYFQNQNCKTIYGNTINIVGEDSVYANFTLPANSHNGNYDLFMETANGLNLSLPNAFTITGGLTFDVQTFQPSTANANSQITATITGTNLQTLMSGTNLNVRLKQGTFYISGTNVIYQNATTATVTFNIVPYANNGFYSLEIVNSNGCFSLPQVIDIQGGVTRQLDNITPFYGNRAQTMSAIISGTYCLFPPGLSSTVIFRHSTSSYQFILPANQTLYTDSNHVSITFTIPPLAPTGFYNITVSSAVDGRSFTLNSGFEVIGNVASGSVYFDADSNGVYNSGDRYIAGQEVLLMPGNITTYSDAFGQYYLPVNNGNYTISFSVQTDWRLTSSPPSYTFTVNNVDVTGNDFGTRPLQNSYAVDVNIISGLPRCNTTVNYSVYVLNNSTTAANGLVYFVKDPAMGFVSANPAASYTNGDTIFWNYSNLLMYATNIYNVFVQMPPAAGTLVNTYAYADIRDVNTIITSDTYTSNQVVRCSFDPNDKMVEPAGEQQFNYVLNTLPLEYTIRFQNTGNDTAFRVVIMDTIDVNMDLNSLTLIGSSHLVEVYVHPGRIIEFRFNNILLPDSNIDEPGSHGFVKFKLNPVAGIQDPTVVENIAGIYFDLNPPVITNSTTTTYVTTIPVGIANTDKDLNRLLIMPNPSKGIARLLLPENYNGNNRIRIVDVQGKVCTSINSNEAIVNLECAGWPAGVYFVEVINQQSGQKMRTKMIIQ